MVACFFLVSSSLWLQYVPSRYSQTVFTGLVASQSGFYGDLIKDRVYGIYSSLRNP